jgi:predicted kinase
VLFVECTASREEVARRLTARAARTDEVSDANVAIYLRQRAEFAALREIPDSSHLVIDTERGLDAAAASIVERLKRLASAGG